jgi:hypothetical protein
MIESFAGATTLASCSASCSLALLGAATGGKDKFTGDRGNSFQKLLSGFVCVSRGLGGPMVDRQTTEQTQRGFSSVGGGFLWLVVDCWQDREESILIDS